MASIKHVREKLFSEAVCLAGCMVGTYDDKALKLVGIGSEAFLECYVNHTYEESMNFAYYRMRNESYKMKSTKYLAGCE